MLNILETELKFSNAKQNEKLGQKKKLQTIFENLRNFEMVWRERRR